MNRNSYEYKALCYAEEYGIDGYVIKKNLMIYYTTFPIEHMTYKAIVNLDTMKEVRTPMDRYYKAFRHIGKAQVNLRV